MKLGKQIRQYRQLRELSQEKAAEEIGMSRLTYAAIETGDKNPTLNELESICSVFNINLSELIQLAEQGDLPKYRQICLHCIQYGGSAGDGKITKTKLAKLLYLVDFYWFRKRGISMSGMQYYKLPLGPVATPFFRMIDEMFENGMIAIEARGPAFLISAVEQPSDLLDGGEVNFIRLICEGWRDKDTQTLVAFTHNQAPWAETESGNLIPYELSKKIDDDLLA